MQPCKHRVNEYFIVDYKIKISEPTTKIFNCSSSFEEESEEWCPCPKFESGSTISKAPPVLSLHHLHPCPLHCQKEKSYPSHGPIEDWRIWWFPHQMSQSNDLKIEAFVWYWVWNWDGVRVWGMMAGLGLLQNLGLKVVTCEVFFFRLNGRKTKLVVVKIAFSLDQKDGNFRIEQYSSCLLSMKR